MCPISLCSRSSSVCGDFSTSRAEEVDRLLLGAFSALCCRIRSNPRMRLLFVIVKTYGGVIASCNGDRRDADMNSGPEVSVNSRYRYLSAKPAPSQAAQEYRPEPVCRCGVSASEVVRKTMQFDGEVTMKAAGGKAGGAHDVG